MPFALIFFIAVRHITVRLRSTLLILAGVGVGVFVNVVMQSMMFGFQGEFHRIILTTTPGILVKGRPRGDLAEGRVFQSGPDVVYAQTRLRPVEKEKGIRNYLSLSQRILAMPGVAAVAPYVQSRALLRYGTRERGVNLFAVDATEYDRVVEFRNKIVEGDADALLRRRDAIVLGVFLAEDLGVTVGSRVKLVGVEGREADLRVVGLFKSGITMLDRTSTFASLSTGQTLLDYSTAVSGIAIKVRDMRSATALARRVEYAAGYETQSWEESNANFFALIRQQNVITFGAVGMTLLVAGFGIANGLVTTVLEKRRDIGILMAQGLRKRDVAAVFVTEGILMGILGTLFGAALGAWGIAVLDATPFGARGGVSTSDTFVMLQSPSVYLYSGFFALLVSALASLFPSLRAARYDPVEIIRTAK